MSFELFELSEPGYSDDDAEWDAFVAAHPHGSLLQTTAWATLKGRFGWRSQRVWLRHDGQIVAGAQLMLRSRALGAFRMAYIPHGPLLDWRNSEQRTVLLNQIDHAAYRWRAGLLKMEPLLWTTEMPAAEWQAMWRTHDGRVDSDTFQPPRTMLLDLRPSEEEILARMKQKTRYNIRVAGRKEVVVREGGLADIGAFVRLMQTTGARNDFGVRSPQYYRDAYALFAPDDAVLLLAEYQGQVLSGAMIFKNGPRAIYLFGGSNDEERQRMPNYAVQWAGIRWARDRGCTSYDLNGVPDAEPDELEASFQERADGLWGVYRFKRGFGGDIVRTVGPVDRVYNRLADRLYQRFRSP